jgi:hypothetical protein
MSEEIFTLPDFHVDFTLLASQQQTVLDLVNSDLTTPAQKEDLKGVLNMIFFIQNYGEKYLRIDPKLMRGSDA